MSDLVAILGGLIAVLGLLGLVRPTPFVDWVRSVWSKRDLLWVAVALRLFLGTLFILAAPECRAPLAMQVLGGITIAAGLSLPFVGSQRLRAFIDWWCRQSLSFVRIWMLAILALGGFLLYAGT